MNYVILITDSETFKLKHFSAYFMLKRLESMLSIPQKLKKISKNSKNSSKNLQKYIKKTYRDIDKTVLKHLTPVQ